MKSKLEIEVKHNSCFGCIHMLKDEYNYVQCEYINNNITLFARCIGGGRNLWKSELSKKVEKCLIL
jgi:hypothetical protein